MLIYLLRERNCTGYVKFEIFTRTMKFSVESTASYNSIHPTYFDNERFSRNTETIYRESTKWRGIFLAFLSGTFFTLSSSLIKVVHNVDPMILLSIRSLAQIVILAIVATSASQNLLGPHGQRSLMYLQGFVGGTTLSLLYYSFRKLPLGDATTIILSSPVIVIALSFLFLKEPCGILRMLVVATLFAGVVCVSKPPFIFQWQNNESYSFSGYGCALLANLFTALNIVVMRKCEKIHYSVLVFNLSTWSLISSLIFFFLFSGEGYDKFHLPTDHFTWILIIMLVIFGLCGQVLVTKALKIEGAGKVSVTRSLDIILAYLIQVWYFGEQPNSMSIIGALLIIFSVFSMGFEREIYGVCDFIP